MYPADVQMYPLNSLFVISAPMVKMSAKRASVLSLSMLYCALSTFSAISSTLLPVILNTLFVVLVNRRDTNRYVAVSGTLTKPVNLSVTFWPTMLSMLYRGFADDFMNWNTPSSSFETLRNSTSP